MTWALDLDGVVWLGDKVIPGVEEAITRLRREGEKVFLSPIIRVELYLR